MENIGPPELPVLIVAVVWKNSASGIVLYTVLGFHRALIKPALNEWLELKQREIGGRFGGDHVGLHRLAAKELHADLVHRMNDVGRGHHLAVRRDQHARARLGEP